MDQNLITCELMFPRELEAEAAARMFEALSGIYKPIRRYGEPFGRGTLVLEILSLPDGLHYLLSFPPNLSDIVRGAVTSMVPGAALEEVEPPAGDWLYAVRLEQRPVFDGRDEPVSPNPKQIPALLQELQGLQEGEAVLVQCVMTPTGNLIGPGNTYFADLRIGARGHKIRAKQLIDRAERMYRGLQMFRARRVPPGFLGLRRTPLQWRGECDQVTIGHATLGLTTRAWVREAWLLDGDEPSEPARRDKRRPLSRALAPVRHRGETSSGNLGIEAGEPSREGMRAMARKIVTELIDDIDGSRADETVGFALDGVTYEIDLTKKNAAGLRNAFAKYVGAGRRTGSGRRPRGTRSQVTSDSRTIRVWAKANNVPVTERGRIPASVVEQFNEANKR